MGLWEGIILGARIVQVVCALIVLGCCAYSASVGFYDGFYGYAISVGQVNFMIFNSVWTLLVVGYQILVPRYSDKLGHKFVILAVDALTTLFWFAGFIALSVFVSVLYGLASSYHALQAACAFGAFAWLAFLATTVLNAINVFRGNTGSAKHNHGDPAIP